MSSVSEDSTSAGRGYTLRKRAEQMEETRRRITEAAMRLHTTVGPANTTISAVADEADVTRVTVYRHFPDQESLFLACSAHWVQLHPAPDPSEWEQIEDFEERVRIALTDLYGFYEANRSDLFPIMRDFEAMPLGFQQAMDARQDSMAGALMSGMNLPGARSRRLRAATRHVTSFWTWRSLAVDGGLDTDDSVEVAVGFILSI